MGVGILRCYPGQSNSELEVSIWADMSLRNLNSIPFDFFQNNIA